MSAPKGNRYHLLRERSGKEKLFPTPEDLLNACIDYFEWVENNPLLEAKIVSYQGESTIESLPKMRAMTIAGLCNHLGIVTQTWDLYRVRKDYIGVCSQVEQIIWAQKFEGASADMLNPSIIVRELGLMDKQQIDNVSSDGSMSPEPILSKEEMKEAVKSALEKI